MIVGIIMMGLIIIIELKKKQDEKCEDEAIV
jgi:hypothetical protein